MKYSHTLTGLFALAIIFSAQITTFAQCSTSCSIACSGQINLSLGDGCSAEVTPWMGGKGVAVGDSICYSVEVFDQYDNLIPGNIVDITHINQLLTYKVIELECNNHCWGNLLVEYKQGPQIVCPPDMTMECSALEYLEIPQPSNLCAAVTIDLINEEHNKLDCDTLYQSIVTRTYRAVDEFGRSNTCSHDIFLERVPIDEIIFPGTTKILCSDENIIYDANGFPLPFLYVSQTDSLTTYSVPFICSNTRVTPYACPNSGVPAINDCGNIVVPLDDMGNVIVSTSLTHASVSASCIMGEYNLSFSSGAVTTTLNLSCADVGTVNYTVYLLDGTTTVATCTNTLTITDPTAFCSGGGTGSGTGSGTPGVGGGTTTSTGGGTTTNSGMGAGCTYGIPLFPNSGGVIITETGDSLKPINTVFVKESNASYLCGAALIYSDVEFQTGKSHCTRKIFRTWEVYEWWCHDELNISSVQTIEIIDDRAPILHCPSDLTISASADCGSDIMMPPVNAFDECGSDVSVMMSHHNNDIHSDGGLVDLNGGMNTITYTVSDACNNSAQCSVNYMVIDYTNPIAICEQEKVISLGSNSFTTIPASVFDNGSFDNCEIKHMQVRRQTKTCHPDADLWGDYGYFCCADAFTGTVPVEFRVTDHSGNHADCIVYVEIQDKANPIITCPPDRTVDCREIFDNNNMGATFGYATLSDNCTNDIPQEVIETEYDQCGVGLLTRTLQVMDAAGNVLAQCKQLITVGNSDPFTADDIIWPLDYDVYDICDADLLTPENLPHPHGFPTYTDNSQQCALLGYDYEDWVFSANPTTGDCAVIQRTWTVINWCGALGDFDTYQNPVPQLIHIKNNTAPVMDPASDLIFEGQEVDCNSGPINITRTATDDCQSTLTWEYTVTEFPSGNIIQKGNSNSIIGKYPVGNYNITWRVSDACGNHDTHIQNVKIQSIKPPTPLCLNGLSASLVGWDLDGDGTIDVERAELWAERFDAGSYPNCGNAMTFSFSSDTTDTKVIFDCSHIGRNNVEMWVTDRLTGAQDFCVAFIDIQDSGECPDQNIVTIAGQVKTESSHEIENVEVSMDVNMPAAMTNNSGSYAFQQMPIGGNYQINAERDVDYLNGVSTIDLIMIQRHILGIEDLDSPYKLIAADVNRSEDIDGVDLVELRKLVLGIYDDLPQNTSWRFVSADYQFLNPSNPWATAFDESYDILNLDQNMIVDFVGVKIGDVNDDVVVSLNGNTVNRSQDVTRFNMRSTALKKNETGSLLVYSDYSKNLKGWQATIEFDADKIAVTGIVSRGIQLEETNYNFSQTDEGWITISYHSLSEKIDTETALFELSVIAREDINEAADLFSISSAITRAEAYDSNLAISKLELGQQQAEIFKIVSVTPNPFVQDAEVIYDISFSDEVEMEFYDISGKQIYSKTVVAEEGRNSTKVSRDQLNVTGFIYVRMRTRDLVSDFRMIAL